MQSGKSSTRAFLRPKSKIRILESGTPLQKRDLGVPDSKIRIFDLGRKKA